VLRYRAGYGGSVATEDLAAAISYIFRNAKALGVGTRDYSLWGSSAGARMAAAIGSHGVAAHGSDMLPKPSVVVMAYTAHSDYSSAEPPTFVVVGEQDGIAPPSSMERRIAALRSAGIEVEYHKYRNLGHGFGQEPGPAPKAGSGRRSVLGKVHHPRELTRGTPRCPVCPRDYSTASNAGGVHSHLRIASFETQVR